MQGHPDWLWREQGTRPGIWGCGDGGITGPAPSLLPVAVRSHRTCPQHASLAMRISSFATTMGQQIIQSDSITFVFPAPWLLPSITNHIHQPTTPPPRFSITAMWSPSQTRPGELLQELPCGSLPQEMSPASVTTSPYSAFSLHLSPPPYHLFLFCSSCLEIPCSCSWVAHPSEVRNPNEAHRGLLAPGDLLTMACPSSASLDARTKLSAWRGADRHPRRTDGEEKLILPIQL